MIFSIIFYHLYLITTLHTFAKTYRGNARVIKLVPTHTPEFIYKVDYASVLHDDLASELESMVWFVVLIMDL